MRTEDQYPSTYDLPRIAGGAGDLVLDILRNARKRVSENWTRSMYISPTGAACAYGAIVIADPNYADRYVFGGGDGGGERYVEPSIDMYLETQATNATMTAIALLNEAAADLYPASASTYDWKGPIEVLNQWDRVAFNDEDGDYDPTQGDQLLDPRQGRVLRCYDHAIELRSGVAV